VLVLLESAFLAPSDAGSPANSSSVPEIWNSLPLSACHFLASVHSDSNLKDFTRFFLGTSIQIQAHFRDSDPHVILLGLCTSETLVAHCLQTFSLCRASHFSSSLFCPLPLPSRTLSTVADSRHRTVALDKNFHPSRTILNNCLCATTLNILIKCYLVLAVCTCKAFVRC
jgi:hypothetical protein